MNLQIYHAAVDFRSYPFKNLNILINPVDHAATKESIQKTKKLLDVTRANNVILDSGGNSLFGAEANGKEVLSNSSLPIKSNGKLNLSPYHVVDAARELEPDVVIALDWPLKKTNSREEQEKEFRKKIPINLEWAKETVKLRNEICPEINLLIPIQAKTLEQLEEFMEGLSGLKFTGVSLPYRNLNPKLLVLFLTRLYQLRIPYVHILGTTCFSYTGIAAYFARNGLIQRISLDSTSWKTNANKGSGYMSPHNLLTCNIDENTRIPNSLRNDCKCPFCKKKTFQEIADEEYSNRTLFLSCHNAWVTEQVAKDLYKNAKSLKQLDHYLLHKKSAGDPKVKQAIDALYLAEALKDENINILENAIE